MDSLFPGAAEIRERLEKKRQEQLAQMQMQQMQQLPQETQQMPTQQVADVGVEDASGNIMSMMDGMTGGVSGGL